MSFRVALRARLISALASAPAAIRWGQAEQKDGSRRVVLRTISDVREQHLKGFNGARATRVQADCTDVSREAANLLAEAVLTAVAQPVTQAVSGGADVRMTLADASGPLDLSEQSASGTIYRQTLDLTIWHDG